MIKVNIVTLVALLIGAQNVQANLIEMVNKPTKMADNKESFALTLENRSSDDLVCDTLSYNVIYDTSAGYQFGGERQVYLDDIYLQAKEHDEIRVFTELAKEETAQIRAEVKKSGEAKEPVIVRAKLDPYQSSCRKANFVDYCKLAPKSQEDEDVLDKLYDLAGVSDCSLIEKRIGKSIKLRGFGLKSVRPISYMKHLKKIDLRENDISDSSYFSKMENLTSLNLEGNPIEEFQPFTKLINLTNLNIKDSLITNVNGIENMLNLRTLNIENTKMQSFEPLMKSQRSLRCVKYDGVPNKDYDLYRRKVKKRFHHCRF